MRSAGAHRDRGARRARAGCSCAATTRGGDTARARPARRGDAAARPRAGRPLRRPRRAARRPRPGRLRRDHEGDRGLRPRRARCASPPTRRRPCSARSSATSATSTWAMRVPRGMQELQLEVAKARDELTDAARPLARPCRSSPRPIDAPFEEVLATIQSAGRAPHALARRADRRGHDAGRLDRRQRPRARPRRDPRAARRRARRASRRATARSCGCASRRTSRRPRSPSRIGVSQMQVSRLIRQSLARLRMDIERNDRGVSDAAAAAASSGRRWRLSAGRSRRGALAVAAQPSVDDVVPGVEDRHLVPARSTPRGSAMNSWPYQ